MPISVLVPWVARHEDIIHHNDVDRGSLRREIRLLADKVQELE